MGHHQGTGCSQVSFGWIDRCVHLDALGIVRQVLHVVCYADSHLNRTQLYPLILSCLRCIFVCVCCSLRSLLKHVWKHGHKQCSAAWGHLRPYPPGPQPAADWGGPWTHLGAQHGLHHPLTATDVPPRCASAKVARPKRAGRQADS